jgi:hypothetical protein
VTHRPGLVLAECLGCIQERRSVWLCFLLSERHEPEAPVCKNQVWNHKNKIEIAVDHRIAKALPPLQLGNLLPVTLGNIIGGAVCVAGVYALAFGRPGNSNAAPAMAAN